MRVYLHQAEELLTNKGETLPKILQRLGAHTVAKDEQEGLDFEKIDAVIVYGAGDDPKISYVIALALAKLKPVLYLVPKGESLQDSLKSLQEDKQMGKLFSFSFFTANKLEALVIDFVNKSEKGDLNEPPSIKFTLRITPSMERYLQWKSKETGMSKADFLRQVIEDDIISQDKDYGKA